MTLRLCVILAAFAVSTLVGVSGCATDSGSSRIPTVEATPEPTIVPIADPS